MVSALRYGVPEVGLCVLRSKSDLKDPVELAKVDVRGTCGPQGHAIHQATRRIIIILL